MINDRILIERAKSGDKRAAEQTVRRFYPTVFRFLRHLTWGHEDAQDLVQQTFLRAAEGLPEFRHQCSFNHWIHQIAYREYLRWLRDRRSAVPLEEAHSLALVETCSPGLIVLFGALDGLDDALRETFLLHEVEGLSVRETAKIMGVPSGTVKSRLSRARGQLQRRLSSMEPEVVQPRLEERNEPT